MIKNFG